MELKKKRDLGFYASKVQDSYNDHIYKITPLIEGEFKTGTLDFKIKDFKKEFKAAVTIPLLDDNPANWE